MLGCELERAQLPICLFPIVDAASRRVLIWAVRASKVSPPLLDLLGNRGTLVNQQLFSLPADFTFHSFTMMKSHAGME